jgi:predicted CXXCH cytochrome family protein
MGDNRSSSYNVTAPSAVFITVMIFLFGLGLLSSQFVNPGHTQAAAPPIETGYIGANACRTCHRGLSYAHAESPHARALQNVQHDKTSILADFNPAEALPQVQWPGEDAARPITAEDVVYAIGTGRYVQRYLVEVAANDYLVLPVEWNTAEASWQPFTLAEKWPDPAYAWGPNCADCHTTGLDISDYAWVDDGVQCESCHGPGGRHAELAAISLQRRVTNSELHDIRSAIYLEPDPQICGQCHSQGRDPSDAHAYPINYRPGLVLVDESVFDLVPETDTIHWWPSGHASATNMQFNEWLDSAHTRASTTVQESDAAQDACLQCHSTDYRWTEALQALYADGTLRGAPPDPVTVATAQWGVTCFACHNIHSQTQPAFITDEPNQACATCHQNTPLFDTPHHPVVEMFEGHALVKGVDGIPSAHFSADDGPDCLTCHMPDVPVSSSVRASHTMRPVLPDPAADQPPDSCAGCHEGLTTADLQFLIADTQDEVRSRLSIGWARLASVSEPEPDTEAHALYERVVTALTFVQNDGSLGVHNYTYTDNLLDVAGRTLAELSVPGTAFQPTEAPAPTAVSDEVVLPIAVATTSASVTLRPVTLLIIMIFVLILLIGAAVFFRRRRFSGVIPGRHDR